MFTMKRVELVDMSGSSLKKQIEKKCNMSHNDGAILRFQIQFAKHRLFAECHRAILRFFFVFFYTLFFPVFQVSKIRLPAFHCSSKESKEKGTVSSSSQSTFSLITSSCQISTVSLRERHQILTLYRRMRINCHPHHQANN